MVLGAHMVLSMTAIFFGNNILPPNAEKKASLGFFECIAKFSFFLNSLIFSLNLVYNESLYYGNCCMLKA